MLCQSVRLPRIELVLRVVEAHGGATYTKVCRRVLLVGSGGLLLVPGIPSRRLVNDVFLNLAVEAGADSGIIDPVTSHLEEVFTLDRETKPYRLAEDMLLGRDQYCKNFLTAYRKGELE